MAVRRAYAGGVSRDKLFRNDGLWKMTDFESPGKFFSWCLEYANSDHTPFRSNYPQYFERRTGSEYLWKSYDRRLQDIFAFARPGVRILEVGCGIGADLHWLALKGADVVGIDVKSEWINAARSLTEVVTDKLGPVSVDIRRVNVLDVSGEQFDLIYMKDTFHHLEPRIEIVEKISELLRPGGTVVIVEPNAWNPFIQYKMFKIRGFNTIIEKIDRDTGERFIYGNERLVSGGSLQALFAGFSISGRVRNFRLLPTVLTRMAPAVALAERLEAAHVDSLLLPCAIHSVFKGKKLV